jgi:class 3 adenylate cyclase/tetratricopeptide (TPR) repeat protein
MWYNLTSYWEFTMPTSSLTQLEAAIAALETQRSALGDMVVDLALQPLREQINQLKQTVFIPHLEGERKLVTVMFADVSGFTAMSEKLDPEQVRSRMNTCFDYLVPVIKKYDGYVDKFIGDAILALFGAPIAYENHAERALRAALNMLEALEDFNRRYGIQLGLHLGINSGLVVAGGIGSQGQQQYSVMGDTVNLAARLEDASVTGQILVGPSTYRLVSHLFDFESLPPIQVKGKSESIPIYNLRGFRVSPHAQRGIEGLHAPMIGRETEMDHLRQAFDQLSKGTGSIIAVIGEAGLGKSRLLAEARQTLAQGTTWVEGRALSYTEGMSYSVARDALYSLVGLTSEAASETAAIGLRGSVERLFGDTSGEVYPYLARLLDLPLDDVMNEQIKYLHAEVLRGRIHKAYADYVQARAQEQPLVLVLEDLHWADPSSLALLEALLPLTQDVPLCILFTLRPEDVEMRAFLKQALNRYENKIRLLELGPLSRGESMELLNSLLNMDNFPESTRHLILSKAEGNAFFLEEVLRSLIDAGMVIIQEEKAIATSAIHQLKALDVPDTLQGVIAARIDRLPTNDKYALQTASVIGRVFQENVLSYLLQQEKVQTPLEPMLGNLQQRELIRVRAEYEYIFKHAVTQDVAYNSLLIARRKALHQVTAEAIERLFPQSVDDLSATLAYHYERADAPEKAVHYLEKAADRAKATYANTEAIAFYRSAIEQVKPLLNEKQDRRRWDTTLAHLYESLGDVLHLIARREEAQEAYEQALAHMSSEDAIWQSGIHVKNARNHSMRKHYEQAFESFKAAEQALGAAPTEPSVDWWRAWIHIQLERGEVYYWVGKTQELSALADQVRDAIECYGTPEQRMTFFGTLTIGSLRQLRYVPSAETLKYARMTTEAGKQVSNPDQRGYQEFMVGFATMWAGHLDEAEQHLRYSLSVAERSGDKTIQTRCLTYLTMVYRKRGDAARVREYAQRSLVSATDADMAEYIGMAKGNLGWAALRESDMSATKTLAEAAWQLLQGTPQAAMFPSWLLWPLMGISRAEGQLDAFIENARILLSLAIQPLPEALSSVLEQAIQAWDAKDSERLNQLVEKSCSLARQFGYLTSGADYKEN